MITRSRSRPSLAVLAGITIFGLLGANSLLFAAPAPAEAAPKPDANHFRPFFDQHCVKCHSGDKPKGDWRIDELTMDFGNQASRDRWQSVLEKLEAGEMPPKTKPRPPEQEVRALSEWITARVAAADAGRRGTEGRVVLRRLNRTEYENTVRDLLGVQSNLKDLLPLDTAANGFDNVGDALHTSSFLMDRYLEAADTALNQAIVNRAQPPPSTKKHYSLKEMHQVKSTTERVFRQGEGDGVALFSSSAWQAVGLSSFYPNERGYYRFRMSVSGIQSAGQPVVFRVWSGSGGMGGAKGHLVSYFDAPPDQPKVIEFVDFMESKTTISILPYGLASSQTVNKVGADDWKEPGLMVDWVEVEGPLNDTWPPESHRRLFGNLPQGSAPAYNFRDRVDVTSQDPAADADRILRAFMRRAFRRPVVDADVQPYTALVAAKLNEKQTFEQAVRVGLDAVMASPEFLFLREKPGKLDAFALASRLSYFLWSSMPDEPLLALAEQGKLDQPAILHAQVERMLQDPKAAAFTENFVGQWLGLREIEATMPSSILYPDFDDMLKLSMVRETELFFTEVLKNDLSLTNFIASDFTMINGRLAKLYGIDGVQGWDFRKVALPPGSHRGGVLTMASVLKVTANGTNTSPVLRGAWVLDRILGTPPAPPAGKCRVAGARHPRHHHDPPAARQTPLRRDLRCLPREDRPARLRPGELRCDRRLAGQLPHQRQWQTGDDQRPKDVVSRRPEGGPRRRAPRRPLLQGHRRTETTPPHRQRPDRPRAHDQTADLRHRRTAGEGGPRRGRRDRGSCPREGLWFPVAGAGDRGQPAF